MIKPAKYYEATEHEEWNGFMMSEDLKGHSTDVSSNLNGKPALWTRREQILAISITEGKKCSRVALLAM